MNKVLETVKEHYIENLKNMHFWESKISDAEKSNAIENVEIYNDIRNDYAKAALTLRYILDEYLPQNEIKKMDELARG